MMVSVLLTDILQKLKIQFRSLALRIDFILQEIHSELVEVLEHIYRPKQIELMLKAEDIGGKSVLVYIAELRLYRFLQINHVNRIVNQMWESKTDIGGSVFDLSTSYYLLNVNQLRYQEDNELRKRFYMPRGNERPMPHRCTLAVWKKSMSLRYSIEAIIFFLLLFIFQFEMSQFNKDLHLSMRELKEFNILNNEIVAKGGSLYDPNDPDRIRIKE